MPVAPTYPGVYIEEIPSGVRTLTGVATSITAFIGYTPRGPVNLGVRVLSFADFERAFGGLAVDSPLSYAVMQFFQNGGSDAVVVRVARGAARARTTIRRLTTGGDDSIRAEATSEGIWGNNLRIGVDYDTLNPASLFNLRVTELVNRDGQFVIGREEVYRNLSMNSFSATYGVRTVNASSELIRLTRVGPISMTAGTSQSGAVTVGQLDPLLALPRGRIGYLLNGQGPFEINVHTTASPLFALADSLATRLTNLGNLITADANARFGAGALTAAVGVDTITFTATIPGGGNGERSAIQFVNASVDNVANLFELGLANGGLEIEGAAVMRPAQTGTRSGTLGALPDAIALTGTAGGLITLELMNGAGAVVSSQNVALWGPGSGTPTLTVPATVSELVNRIVSAIERTAALAGATVSVIDRRIRLVAAPSANPNQWYRFAAAGADTTADEINLIAADADENFAHYTPGAGAILLAQSAVVLGNDGTAPGAAEFRGSEAAKTGVYALEDVDLFNIVSVPEVSDFSAGDMSAVYTEVLAYCVRRRAFLIIDLPGTVDTLTEAQTWLAANGTLRSRNSAAYFPRFRAPDPLLNSVLRPFPPSGALAGLYARTDAERGVWKAPAGTAATIVGAMGVDVALNDRENGVLNPAGLNAIRLLNLGGVSSIVSWGARTLRGADILADEYKYIPVRRLALFLEESLYRGTQWVVFEPNDEPLWAQIRLNLGAFMHTLFAQGAFQGRTPREAYFVKCDKETTTQNDIDLGRVNIVVGFAPLKPAEFVIIKIQQIAGAIQT